MTELESIYIEYVSDADLKYLEKLENLVLGHMNINDVTPLSELKALRFILLAGTAIFQ